jgi:signal transduction histidine kinase/signal recognition particle receptor subunit beta
VAQWSHAEKTLYAKLVYYGPAFGGKTTNLESLHRLTDPEGSQQLLSLKTSDDRTLFFDLLPFDLGTILGYQVAMKLYTVPGQVHYDATRRVVLAGADAVIFVADSSPDRQRANRESLENLRVNMRANGLSPETVPVVLQFNKQDLPDALTPEQVGANLGAGGDDGFPAVAIDGTGVVDTFLSASRAMIRRLAAFAGDVARRGVDVRDLDTHLHRAFAPILARAESSGAVPALPAPVATAVRNEVVADGEDLVEGSVRSSLRLGEDLTEERGRTSRLRHESRALRQLCEILQLTGASFDEESIVERMLALSSEVVGAAVITLVFEGERDAPPAVRVCGRERDPLLSTPQGTDLLRTFLNASGPCVVDDFQRELADFAATPSLEGIRAVAVVPLPAADRRVLVGYAPMPDGAFDEGDVRFLATVASQLAVALEKADLYRRLASHRDLLETSVADRTRELRKAYDDLREMERVKDRFLSNVSHEMKTPLTAVVNAATLLRDYEADEATRREMGETILESCRKLETLLDAVFRTVRTEIGERPLRPTEVTPAHLAAESAKMVKVPGLSVEVDPRIESMVIDLPRMAQAVANLLDNAAKFSPPGTPVEMRVQAGPDGGMVLRVLDRGTGVPSEDRDRIFAPFEQGGDAMTGKPSGVGLGLHEARSIARQHGGTLDYLPRDGGGSEFRLTVPPVDRADQDVPEVAHG